MEGEGVMASSISGLSNPVDPARQSIDTSAALEQTLGQDAFLKLLVTELKQQDPLSPKQDKEFIAELAQFSSLEQMNNLNDKFAEMLASVNTTSVVSMLGKVVEGLSAENLPVSGIATSVRYEDGKPLITIKDGEGSLTELPIDRVTQVLLNPTESGE